MTKQLKWRLGKLPTPDEVTRLVNDKIITKEEAREILFNQVEEEERDTESYKSEIKFLREMIEKLAHGRDRIIETIKIVEQPYVQTLWIRPYITWANNTLYKTGDVLALRSNNLNAQAVECSFSAIQI